MRLRLRLDRLSALLAASRLSQNHWALKLGLSRGHWSDLVNGRHPYPSAGTRDRMLELFGVPLEELFEPDESPRTAELDFRASLNAHYEIIEELGQGGMGTVYLANDRALARLVAIKVVSPEAAAGVGAAQLLQEIAHVGRLQHPNILPLFDAAERAGHPYYVMPHVREGSLGALLRRRGRLPLPETIALVGGIARGLDHAHARHLLHCDVKPENILVQDGHPYVMDFGIARTLHSEAAEWTGIRRELDFSAGTPAYVSPEQAAGDRALDQRSDVFSLACMTYEMLAGRTPFDGRNTEEVVTLRFRAPAPPLRDFAPDVPATTAAVLERAMSIDPARRPPTALAFADELRHSAIGASAAVASVSVAASRGATWLRSRAGISGPPRLAFPMIGIVSDLRYVSRALRRNWRFALGVILSLGLGLGLGLPALGLADHLFLRPPAYVQDPGRVMRLVMRMPNPKGGYFFNEGLSGLDYLSMSAGATTLGGVAGYMNTTMSNGRGTEARPISVSLASPSLFGVLGAHPLRGRFYADAEDVPGIQDAPAVISAGYWRREFGGDPAVIGKTLDIGRVRYTIVGVAPDGFTGVDLTAVDAWLPLRVATPDVQGPGPQLWTTDRSFWLHIFARLKPGVAPEVAAADANRVYRGSGPRARDPEWKAVMLWDPLANGRSSSPNRNAKLALWIAGGGALLLVLITANLLNLFLARNAANARQVAVRLAIGGGRRQLLRLHLLEALVLGALASAVGLAISVPAVTSARALLLPTVSWARPALDLRIAWIALALSVCIGGIVALWTTAHAARIDPATLLRAAGSGRSTGPSGGHAARRALLVTQSAIFAVLLAAASAFVVSVRRASATEFGFDVDRVIAANAPLQSVGYTRERVHQFFAEARERVAALPDVESASLGYMEAWQNNRFERVTLRDPAVQIPSAFYMFEAVTPEYPRTFGLAMREGRWVEPTDAAGSAPVVVVNEAMARLLWPGASAIGECVRIGADSLPCRTIVGVVRSFRVSDVLDAPISPAYYLPVTQAAAFNYLPRLFVRPRGDVQAAVRSVRHALQGMAPDVPAATVRPVSDNAAPLLAPFRLGASVFTAFGLLAAIVAGVGLLSVLSFLVVERRREYAIRVALGAPAQKVVAPVVRQTVVNVGLGLVLGFVATVALSRVLEPMLFHTKLLEPVVVVTVALLAVTIGVVATIGPVRRVLGTDAMEVLRSD